MYFFLESADSERTINIQVGGEILFKMYRTIHEILSCLHHSVLSNAHIVHIMQSLLHAKGGETTTR